MKREQQVFLIATILFASWSESASAATVIATTVSPASFSSGSNLLSLTNISNANQLVSISGGTVTNGEGGTFSIDIHYSNGSTSQIFSTLLSNNVAFNLTSVPLESFTTGTINGLVFNLPAFSALSIPSGTNFTFNTVSGAVPEPASWAMMLMGFGAIGYAFRRRPRKALAA